MPTTASRVRHTREYPCTVCGGFDQEPRHEGRRCGGYRQGAWDHCTREEHAGTAQFNERSNTYSHRVAGPCPCGAEHSPGPTKGSVEKGQIVKIYAYHDEEGHVSSEVVRRDPKGFFQRRPNGAGGHIYDRQGVRQVPYQLHELLAAQPGSPVFVAEGEKDVDQLVALGLTATCNPEGAGKWRSDYNAHFEGRGVIILPDNDEPGRRHAIQVAESLATDASSVRIVPLPNLPDGGDVSDWLEAGGTREQLLELARNTLIYEASGEVEVNGASPRNRPVEKITTSVLAEIIAESQNFAMDAGERLYRYVEGCYVPGAERYLRSRVKQIHKEWDAASSWTSHRSEEVIRYIKADARVLMQAPPTNIINVENGLLEVSDPANPKLLPHSPEHLSPIRIPVWYDPDADCPRVKAFAADVWPADALSVFFEVPAVAMIPGLAKDKAILLIGSGGTGKSTYLRLQKEFIGRRNCTAMSLQRIENNRFATAQADGKLLNISPDLPAKHLETSSTFKAWTGGDTLTGEHKHQDAFSFVPQARLLFSANHYPRSADAGEAFFDRWHVVEFTNVFRGTEAEMDQNELIAEMVTPTERSGILNEALMRLAQFRGRGNRYEVSASMRAAWLEFRNETDPLAVWLDQHIVATPDAVTTKEELLQAYNRACHDAGRHGMTPTAFGRALKDTRPELFNGGTEKQRTLGGQVKWVWLGVGLRVKDNR